MKRWILIVVCLAVSGARGEVPAAGSYGGRPYIRTFRSADIYSSGPIRCFAETAGGNYFIGSETLSVYDGSAWRRVEARGVRGIRGLAVADGRAPDRVWVASQTAAGFVERDEVGSWRFTTLGRAAQAAGEPPATAYLGVAATAAGAIFTTAESALRWNGTGFERWRFPSPGGIKSCAAADGGIWIWQEGRGLWKIRDFGPPELVRSLPSLGSSPVLWMLPPSQPPADGRSVSGFIFGTATEVFVLTAAGYDRMPRLSAEIANQIPVGATALTGNAFAIHTLDHGIVFAGRDGTINAVVNRSNGLRDNAVYALWTGRVREEIWAGLDDGCQRISSLGRISMLDFHEGLDRGTTRRVVSADGETYVVTNKAVYRIEPAPDGLVRLHSLIESNPGLADAAVAEGTLWVGGYRGLWRAKGDSAVAVAAGGTSPVEALVARDGGAAVDYVQDGELRTFSARDGSSVTIRAKLESHVVGMISDSRFGIWLSTEDNKVEHLAEVSPGRFELKEEFSEDHGLPALSGRPMLATAGGRVFVFTDRQILEWARGKLETPTELAPWIARAGDSAAGQNGYWIVRRRETRAVLPYSLMRVEIPSDQADPIRLVSLRCAGLDAIGQIESVSVTHDTNGTWIWVGGEDGVVRAAAGRLDSARASSPRVAIRQAVAAGDTDRFLPLMSPVEVVIAPGVRHVRFVFSPAEPVDPGAEFYETRLQGVDSSWSGPQSDNQHEFTGLSPGHYIFNVRRMDRFGNAGPAAEYRFSLAPPWYDRWPARTAAAAGALLAFGGLLRWRVGRLSRQAARLDRLVANRTRALELSNVARSEFLENISHEIRNPLNGLTGLLSLMDEKALPQKDRRLAESLRAVAADLTRIFDQVLNFSKAEYGYVQLETQPFLLKPILTAAIDLAAPLAAQRNSTLTLIWSENMTDGFEGDPDKIRAILGNLVGNAIKYAPGRIEAAVSSEPAELGISDIIIEIIDHGPGIPLDEQELIFEKFVRGSNAKGGLAPGTGLGLALCRAYARLMGGSIHVDSQPGAGSVFVVQLPLRKSSRPDRPKEADEAAGSTETEKPFLKTALIVEDEAYNRLILQTMMDGLGWKTESAENISSATGKLERVVFDAVLLDLELPDGKGLEVARFIRTRAGQRPIIVATTGHDSDEMRQRCRDVAMDGFLVKPYTPGELRRVLAAATAGDSSAFAPRAWSPSSLPTTEVDPSALHLLEIALAEKSGGGTDLFVAAVDEEIDHLKRAIAASDPTAAATAAHRLRALAGLIGSGALSACAAQIETQVAATPDVGLERLAELQGIWQRVRREVAKGA